MALLQGDLNFISMVVESAVGKYMDRFMLAQSAQQTNSGGCACGGNCGGYCNGGGCGGCGGMGCFGFQC